MLEKEGIDYRVFNNRIRTFLDYVEMYNDEEIVEIYLYDLIAFTLSNKQNGYIDEYFEQFIVSFICKMNDENEIVINGFDLNVMYNIINYGGVSKELEKVFEKMYILNEKKRECEYKLKYRYYENISDKEQLMQQIYEFNLKINVYVDLIKNYNYKQENIGSNDVLEVVESPKRGR